MTAVVGTIFHAHFIYIYVHVCMHISICMYILIFSVTCSNLIPRSLFCCLKQYPFFPLILYTLSISHKRNTSFIYNGVQLVTIYDRRIHMPVLSAPSVLAPCWLTAGWSRTSNSVLKSSNTVAIKGLTLIQLLFKLVRFSYCH